MINICTPFFYYNSDLSILSVLFAGLSINQASLLLNIVKINKNKKSIKVHLTCKKRNYASTVLEHYK